MQGETLHPSPHSGPSVLSLREFLGHMKTSNRGPTPTEPGLECNNCQILKTVALAATCHQHNHLAAMVLNPQEREPLWDVKTF